MYTHTHTPEHERFQANLELETVKGKTWSSPEALSFFPSSTSTVLLVGCVSHILTSELKTLLSGEKSDSKVPF